MFKTALCALLALVACASSSLPSEGPHPRNPCDQSGWCWERGTPIVSMGGGTLSTVHALGATGEFLRWEGGRWVADLVPTERWLISGWVAEDGTAWAIDRGQRVWINEGSWRQTGQDFSRVFGAADGSVWAESGEGPMLRVGDDWRRVFVSPDYSVAENSLVILSPTDVWSAGLERAGDEFRGALHHFDGSVWRPVELPATPNRYPVLVASGDTVRLHDYSDRDESAFDRVGSTWVAVDETDPDSLDEVPEGCGEVLVVDDEAWCAAHEQIYHRDENEWRPTLIDPYRVTMSPERWGQVPTVLWSGENTRLAWGSGPSDVYRVRAELGAPAEHYDGHSWTAFSDEAIYDIHGTGRDDVWFATADGLLLHFDGAMNWLEIPAELASSGLWVHALGGGAVVVASWDGSVAIYDGEWTVLREGGDRVVDLAGTGRDDIWILESPNCRCEYSARWQHFDGTEWETGEWGNGIALAQSAEQVWLLSASSTETIQSLLSTAPVIAGDWAPHGSSLFFANERFWITTPWQARSFQP